MLSVGGVPDGGANGKPKDIASQAAQEGASLRGGKGVVALAGQRGDLGFIVGGILHRNGEFGIASTAILNIVVERLEIGGRDFGGTSRRA